MANSKDLVTQLTNQIIEDIDDEVRQLVLDSEKRIKEQQEDNFTERQVDCNCFHIRNPLLSVAFFSL